MSTHWAILSALLLLGHCQASYPSAVQLFHFIPVRLYTPEFLQDSTELRRPTRQQQIIQEVVVENNFGGGGFGIPPPPLIGGLGRPGLGFGGRPGLIPGRGFGGSFGGGFGGSFGSGPFLGTARDSSDAARSYAQADGDLEQPAPAAAPAPAPCSVASPTSAASVPSPPCATNYVFSCQAVFKPVPCATAGGTGCYD